MTSDLLIRPSLVGHGWCHAVKTGQVTCCLRITGVRRRGLENEKMFLLLTHSGVMF